MKDISRDQWHKEWGWLGVEREIIHTKMPKKVVLGYAIQSHIHVTDIWTKKTHHYIRFIQTLFFHTIDISHRNLKQTCNTRFLRRDSILTAYSVLLWILRRFCRKNLEKACSTGLYKHTRIEPVGKPYREVCLRSELWPWMVHQPNSWSKHPGTRIEQVLAYCRDEQKYVGCIELLFCLTVTMTFGVQTWNFIGLMDEIVPIYPPSFTEIRSKIREK